MRRLLSPKDQYISILKSRGVPWIERLHLIGCIDLLPREAVAAFVSHEFPNFLDHFDRYERQCEQDRVNQDQRSREYFRSLECEPAAA